MKNTSQSTQLTTPSKAVWTLLTNLARLNEWMPSDSRLMAFTTEAKDNQARLTAKDGRWMVIESQVIEEGNHLQYDMIDYGGGIEFCDGLIHTFYLQPGELQGEQETTILTWRIDWHIVNNGLFDSFYHYWTTPEDWQEFISFGLKTLTELFTVPPEVEEVEPDEADEEEELKENL
jgi:hypothetical protein